MSELSLTPELVGHLVRRVSAACKEYVGSSVEDRPAFLARLRQELVDAQLGNQNSKVVEDFDAFVAQRSAETDGRAIGSAMGAAIGVMIPPEPNLVAAGILATVGAEVGGALGARFDE
jgi:hypothetical protein